MSFDWTKFPLCQTFLTGAAHANSMPPHLKHDNEPSEESLKLLPRAEQDLEEVLFCAPGTSSREEIVYILGYLADSGYTLKNEDEELKIYEILDMEY